MRELCIEDIAMSTRVALPMYLGCRMSELRRHLVPSPTPSQDHSAEEGQVRRNLFGPIDHEENLKFVQDELAKIAQCDRQKWNYDFETDRPLEGRYHWEPVKEGVPQAYEMPRLDYLSTKAITATTSTTSTTPHAITTTSSSTSTSTSTSSITSVSSPSVSSVPECSTPTIKTSPAPPKNTVTSSSSSSSSTPTTQTSEKPTFTKTSTHNQPSCSSDNQSSSEIVVVRSDKCNNTRGVKRTLTSVRNSRSKSAKTPSSASSGTTSTQPKVTAFMKIKKRAAPTKRDDEQPPPLVKRPKTTTS
ncbi:cyclin-dependent kinase inhibitor 1B-like [Macrobrachium rosenbergii]|uniref:cyclin-dependent kinase inhibitor 1B-like n=1 Tax=Macrobrachium rosenbergii TaxID=79674 RepID=UPI0034D5D739